MAKIYIGNAEAADKGLLDALRRLGENYHVFVEFQIPNPRGQRQVDFLVIRADNVKPSIFMLEVKNERRRLRGTINGPWEYEDGPGFWRTLPVSNPRDQNPIQQAYNTARTMQSWLSSMRTLIQDPEDPWPDVPTVFPRLVLPVAHPENQLQTDSFTWRFDGYERTIDSMMSFIPRDPVPLSNGVIERMAQHLGVQREPEPVAKPVEETSNNGWLRATLDDLLSEVSALRREVRELRLMIARPQQAAYAPRTSQQPYYHPSSENGSSPRDIDVAMHTLVDVIRDLKANGRKLVFPNVQEGLWRRLGEFNVEDYGFFKFKEFLQEAEHRGVVSLRIVDGVDYVALPGEEMQVGASNGPSSIEDLTLDERTRFIESIAELETRSAYMIRSYIARHLTAAAVLPLPMYEVRALVNDAVNRGLFHRGTRPFRHPATGEMQSLETLTLELSHPWVADVLRANGSGGEPQAERGDFEHDAGEFNGWQHDDWREEEHELAEAGEVVEATARDEYPARGYYDDATDHHNGNSYNSDVPPAGEYARQEEEDLGVNGLSQQAHDPYWDASEQGGDMRSFSRWDARLGGPFSNHRPQDDEERRRL